MMGPGQTTALNWEEASWCLLRMKLLGTGPSTPPSSGGILLQDFFVVWRCGQDADRRPWGRPPGKGQARGFSDRMFTCPISEPSGTFIYSYMQYTSMGACCTLFLSERLKQDADQAPGLTCNSLQRLQTAQTAWPSSSL